MLSHATSVDSDETTFPNSIIIPNEIEGKELYSQIVSACLISLILLKDNSEFSKLLFIRELQTRSKLLISLLNSHCSSLRAKVEHGVGGLFGAEGLLVPIRDSFTCFHIELKIWRAFK